MMLTGKRLRQFDRKIPVWILHDECDSSSVMEGVFCYHECTFSALICQCHLDFLQWYRNLMRAIKSGFFSVAGVETVSILKRKATTTKFRHIHLLHLLTPTRWQSLSSGLLLGAKKTSRAEKVQVG